MKNKKIIIIAMIVLMTSMLLISGCTGELKDTKQTTMEISSPINEQYESNDSSKNYISVSGEGLVNLAADVGYINIGVENKDKDVKIAQEDNARVADAIFKAVKELGLTDEDITTSNYSIYPEYDYNKDDSVPQAYNVSNMIRLRVVDLGTLGEVIDAATQAGANRAYNISFDVLDSKEAQNKALELAYTDAKAKADLLANAAGVNIIGIASINDNSYYSSPIQYDMAYTKTESVRMDTPISSGDIGVRANVSVNFLIN